MDQRLAIPGPQLNRRIDNAKKQKDRRRKNKISWRKTRIKNTKQPAEVRIANPNFMKNLNFNLLSMYTMPNHAFFV